MMPGSACALLASLADHFISGLGFCSQWLPCSVGFLPAQALSPTGRFSSQPGGLAGQALRRPSWSPGGGLAAAPSAALPSPCLPLSSCRAWRGQGATVARDPEDWGAVLWHSLGLAWVTPESTDGNAG